MKTLTRLLILSILIILFSCQENKNSKQLENINNLPEKGNTTSNMSPWISLKELTPLSFLDMVLLNKGEKDQLNLINIKSETPINWVKTKDVDTLIALTKSKIKCRCVVDPLSSYLPNDSAELGGYAILLLKQFKEKKNILFDLYACPKTDEKEAEKLSKWWANTKK